MEVSCIALRRNQGELVLELQFRLHKVLSLTANVRMGCRWRKRQRKAYKKAHGHSQDSRLMLTAHAVLEREQLDGTNVIPSY